MISNDDRRDAYADLNNKRIDFLTIIQFALIPQMDYRLRALAYATRASYCIPSNMTADAAANQFMRYIDHYSIDENSTPKWMRPSWVNKFAPKKIVD
jgi:hypothetical protein